MLVDSHCHLDYKDFRADFDEILSNAKEKGVCAILNAGVNLAGIEEQLELSKKVPFVWNAVGIHPHDAKDYPDFCAQDLLKYVNDKKVVAIGECGLDYYYNHSEKDIQKKVFETQIKVAQECNLPIIIHTRDADDDMIEILDDYYQLKPFKAVIHCFSGSQRLADFAISKGFYISASGIVTFNKSFGLQEVFKSVPLENLLVETDAPFLAPAPFRGKRNEPAFVYYVAEKLAQLKNVSLDDIAEITTNNFFRLFVKASDKKGNKL